MWLIFFLFGSFTRAFVQTATWRMLCWFLERLPWSLLLWFAVFFHTVIHRCVKSLSVSNLSAIRVLFCGHLFNWLFVKLDNVNMGPASEAFRNGRFLDDAIAGDELFRWVDTFVTFAFVVAAEVNTLRPLVLESLLRLQFLILSLFFRGRLTWLWLFLTIDPNWLLLVVIHRWYIVLSSFTRHSRLGCEVRYGVITLLLRRVLNWDHVGLHWCSYNTFYSSDDDGGILVSERLWNALQNLWSTRQSSLANDQVRQVRVLLILTFALSSWKRKLSFIYLLVRGLSSESLMKLILLLLSRRLIDESLLWDILYLALC